MSRSPATRGGHCVRIGRSSVLRVNVDVEETINTVEALASAVSKSETLALACRRDDFEKVCLDPLKLGHIESFHFSTSLCPPGHTDAKLRELLVRMPKLTELKLADGFYCYGEAFQALPETIETLSLVDTSHLTVLNEAVCKSLAEAIRKLPNLRHFELHRARFESRTGWNLIQNALRTRPFLQEVRLSKFSTSVQPHDDFALAVMMDPYVCQQRAIAKYLKRHKLDINSIEHRMEAFLNMEHCKSDLTALPVIADRPDFVYELLRNKVDPGVWSKKR